jgi:ribonuclease R
MATRMTEFLPSLEDAFKQFVDAPRYRPMTRSEIAGALRLPSGQRRELRALLRRLQTAGEIVLLRKNRWARPDAGRTVTGDLSVHARGYGTVDDPEHPGAEIRIDPGDLRNAIHGDRVVVERLSGGAAARGRRRRPAGPPEARGRIRRVVERRHPVLAGLVKQTAYYWYLIPAHPRFPGTVRIREFAPGVRREDGRMAAVELDAWNPAAPLLAGRAVEDLGRPDEPGVDMAVLLRQHNLTMEFPRAVGDEVRRLSPQVSAPDLDGRRDLRALPSVTIDPADAKDFDDAVSLAPRADGRWDLHVHIADVAHFVPAGGAVDREARERGTSVYLVDRTLTMLPRDLTTDVCSLRPDADRLCHTVRMVLDPAGLVVEEETFPSVIRSRARLDYDTVQALLAGGTQDAVDGDLRAVLRDMGVLAARMRGLRLAAGALAFNVPEVRIELDSAGRVAAIHRRGADEAYGLIEEFMLAANRAVARRMSRARVPALYRIHEPPDDEQWAGMADALAGLGVHGFAPDSASLNGLVSRVSGTPIEYPVAVAILRHLKRAEYSPRCAGHFGLAFKPYTHFTSPIRRYPDLVVHRILCALESGAEPPYGHDEIARIAVHASRTERAAQEAERESVDLKRIGHYRDLLDRGETGPLPAVVTGVIPRGLLVEVVATLQRGLIPGHYLRGGRASRASPGQALDVDLVRVDTHRKLVDFRPSEAREAVRAPGDREPPRGRRRQRMR